MDWHWLLWNCLFNSYVMSIAWYIILGIIYFIVGGVVIRIYDDRMVVDTEDVYVALVLIFPLVILYATLKRIADTIADLF